MTMKTKITILTAVLLLAGAIGSANAANFSAGPGGGDRPSGPSDISDAPGGNGPSGPGDISDAPDNDKPSGPSGKASSGNGGATEDKYCKNGSSKFPDCNTKFIQDCKAAGGNMSGQQGWGGKTCREPS
jgi:hypothetical protein